MGRRDSPRECHCPKRFRSKSDQPGPPAVMTMTAEKNDVNGTRLVHPPLHGVGRKLGILGPSDAVELPINTV